MLWRMQRHSAGLLMVRRAPDGSLEYFLVHPGGPFHARRDAGAWSIPKGEIEPGEAPLEVALREFLEETGQSAEACGAREFVALGSVRQAGGKVVDAWAFAGDWPDGAVLASNTFELEWPRDSGRMRTFPEVDRGEFCTEAEARRRINAAQAAFLDRAAAHFAERA
jgi:predicted NUDIX family NTP pyrophosphohydrolase